MMRTRCLGWLVVVLGACGGRVIEEPGSDSAGSSASDSGDGKAASAGTTSKPSGSGSGSLPTHDLGDCKPGFSQVQNPTRACPWIIENGQCFDTQDDACACVCMSESNVCWSGFPKSVTPTLVHCN